MYKKFLLGWVATLTCTIASGQSGDSTAHRQLSNALLYSQRMYQAATAHSQHLYNGREYYIYDSPAKEHQFFESEDWEESTLTYDGQEYKGIPMLFDIYKEEVIIDQAGFSGNINLHNEKIASFTLLNHQFIRINQPNAGLKTGFYDLLYDGKTQFLVKRTKNRQETLSDLRVTIHYYPKNQYFILKGNMYHPVRSKGSVLKVMEEHKKELKKYLRNNQIIFRSDPEYAIAKMSAYYDQLTRP
jgi:hypothetical protein